MRIRFHYLILLLLSCNFPFLSSAQFRQVSNFDSPIINLFKYKNKLWANTLLNGLYVTDSSQQSWKKRWTLSYDSTLNATRKYGSATVINQIIPYGDSLYAGTAAGIFISSDEGLIWVRLQRFQIFDPSYNSLRDLSVQQIAFSPTAIIALLDNGTKTAISTDKGRTWSTPTPTRLPNGNVLPYDQFRAIRWISNRWYLLTSRALFTSNDNGISWQATSLTVTNDTFSSLAADGNILLVGASTPAVYGSGAYDFAVNLYFSSNTGATWELKTVHYQGPKYRETNTVNVTINNGRLYASSLGGVWYSQADSLQWISWNEGISYKQEQGITSNPDVWNGYSESTVAVLNNQLFCSFTIESAFSYPLTGNLFARSLAELDNTYLNAPVLPWVQEITDTYNLIRWKEYNAGETSFRIERTDLTAPEGFQEIGTVASDSIHFRDHQINPSLNYIYRIRTEKNGVYSTYSPTVRTYRYNNCSQVKEIAVPRLLSQPSPDVIYALAGTELIKSTNTGRNWQELSTCYGSELTYVDLQFRSETKGVILAKGGSALTILLKTSDGGVSWTMVLPKLPDSGLEGTRIYFISDLTGYLIAKTSSDSESSIYITTDGGITYTRLLNSPTLNTNVVFSGQDIIAGIARKQQSSNFELRLSTDGGQNWVNRPVPYAGVSKLVIVDTSNFLMLSSPYGFNKNLFRSTDAGRSWQKIVLPRPATDTTSFNDYWTFTPFQDIAFVNKSLGFIIGGRPRTVDNNFGVTPQKIYLFRTLNGGSTWTEVPLTVPAEIVLTTISFNGMKGIINGVSIYDMEQSSLTSSWAKNARSRYIYTTDNSGSDWILTCQLDNIYPQSIAYRTPKEGYMIGQTFQGVNSTNSYYKTVDGGVSWQKMFLPTGEDTWEVYFLNSTTGFITTKNSVFITSDGGLSWSKKNTLIQLFETYYSSGYTDYVQLFDYTRSYFLNENSWLRVDYMNKVYRTDDAGNSWSLLPTPGFTGMPKISFITPQIGFITGKERNLSGQIYRTTNGGQTWLLLSQSSSIESDLTTSLKFISSTVGFAVDRATRITRDGGHTWRTLSTVAYNSDIFFLDSLTGYIGNFYRTSDGGNNLFASGLDQHSMWPFTIIDRNTAYGYNYKVRLGTPPCSLITSSLSTTYCVGNTITLSNFKIYNSLYRYQWYRNTTSFPVAGQNTATLTIPNAKDTDAGMYFCITSNDCDTASSTPMSFKSAPYISSLQDGDWNNAYIWSCNRAPISSDVIQLNHQVYIPYYKEVEAHQIRFNTGGRLIYQYGTKLKISN